MKTTAYLLLALPLATSVLSDSARSAGNDPFQGTYTKALGFHWDGERHRGLTITKTNGVYYLNNRAYTLQFTNSSPTQLRNESMGTITLGQMSFADQKKEHVRVLRCDFCYESFLLIEDALHGTGGRKNF